MKLQVVFLLPLKIIPIILQYSNAYPKSTCPWRYFTEDLSFNVAKSMFYKQGLKKAE